MAHKSPFSTSTLRLLSNDIKNVTMRGVLTPIIELWSFGSPDGLPSSHFGSVSLILTFSQSRVATHMHMSHSMSSCSNPSAPQATWNVGCSVPSIVRKCSKEVTPGTTVSRRWRKKGSPMAGCMKYIRPIAFSPYYRANQTFSRIFQTWLVGKSTYTTFRPFAFWALYAK
jgi:hypothetical protein